VSAPPHISFMALWRYFIVKLRSSKTIADTGNVESGRVSSVLDRNAFNILRLAVSRERDNEDLMASSVMTWRP